MLFGIGPYIELTTDTFKLDDPKFYFVGDGVQQMKFYIGLSAWGEMKWIKADLKENQMRPEYFKRFNVIELNATHYKIYDEDAIKNWTTELTHGEFLFCPKMYKGISYAPSTNKEYVLNEFLLPLSGFGKHLGPIFIQLQNIAPSRKDEILEFLRSLPNDKFEFFLELRHPAWFNEGQTLDQLSQELCKLGIGLVLTDTPMERRHVHMKFTTDTAFIRFVCDGAEALDLFRIEEWKEKMEILKLNGIKRVFFFLHIHDKASIPSFYQHVVKEFTT